MEQFVAKRDIIENILQDLIEYPLKSGLEMTDGDWEVIQDLITVLEPFKVGLSKINKFLIIKSLKKLVYQWKNLNSIT